MSANPGLRKMNGLLLVDKEAGSTSFQLVSLLRKATKIETIGHAGTLDPFATGVMVMLIGREYTRKSEQFLHCDKQYKAMLHLGIATNTHDLEGEITSRNSLIPTEQQIHIALSCFQGEIQQVPPMFSAKKIKGKKLYDLARKGITIERQPCLVRLKIELLSYRYPHLEILVDCSKGTYIRTLADDLGKALGCGAHLIALCRTKSGSFTLEECIPHQMLKEGNADLANFIRRS